jgi:hypothetical protein
MTIHVPMSIAYRYLQQWWYIYCYL